MFEIGHQTQGEDIKHSRVCIERHVSTVCVATCKCCRQYNSNNLVSCAGATISIWSSRLSAWPGLSRTAQTLALHPVLTSNLEALSTPLLSMVNADAETMCCIQICWCFRESASRSLQRVRNNWQVDLDVHNLNKAAVMFYLFATDVGTGHHCTPLLNADKS